MVERVLFAPGGATEAKQDDIIVELQDIEAAIGGGLTDAELRATPVPISRDPDQMDTKRVVVTSSGTTAIHNPGGNAIRLYWVGLSGKPTNTADVKVGLRWTGAGTDFLEVWISQYGGMFSHNWKGGEAYVLGGVGENLVVNLDAAQEVIVNIDYQEV